MGYLSTMAMIESGADRKVLLRWHLQTNHHPPVSVVWIPCCEWVIDRALAAEPLDGDAPVPEGYAPMTGVEVLEGLHLGPFVQQDLAIGINPED